MVIIDIKAIIGMRIKELRKEKNLSQEKLAYLSNLDRTYLNGVENGRRNISIINMNKIITALEITYSYFYTSKLFIGSVEVE